MKNDARTFGKRKSGVKMPEVIGLCTERDPKTEVIYEGEIVISLYGNTVDKRRIEEILLHLKHCFTGEHDDIPDWLIEQYRYHTGKHARMAVMYLVTEVEDCLVVRLYRSMAKGASGAHQLRRITMENWGNKNYTYLNYNGKPYYVVPLTDKEANRLMELFVSMATELLEDYLYDTVGETCENESMNDADGGVRRRSLVKKFLLMEDRANEECNDHVDARWLMPATGQL